MKNKVILLTTMLLATTASVACIVNFSNSSTLIHAAEGYSLVVGDVSLDKSGSFTAYTASGYPISFTTKNASELTGGVAVLQDGGNVMNVDKIKGANTVSLVYTGNLKIYGSIKGESYFPCGELSSGTPLELTHSTNYLKFVADGEVTINQIIISYSCSEASDVDPFLYSEKVLKTISYKNAVENLPKVHVYDETDDPVTDDDIVLQVTNPSKTSTIYDLSTYVYEDAGLYQFEYSATGLENIEFDVNAKEEFVIGWDKRMHTAGISGLTSNIIDSYVAYIDPFLGGDFANVAIATQGFDEANATTLINQINSSDCDMLIGFTDSTIGSGSGKVHDVAHTAGRIAETVGNRFISQFVDSEMAKIAYDSSITSEGFSSLKVKELKIAWYDNGKVPQSMRDAADLAIEAFLADSGYDIEVTSIAYEKGTGVSYDDVHNAIVNDECAFGINWGSNFNLDSGFKFKNARLHSGLKIGGTAGRYTIGFVKTNGNNYKFYDDIFDFLYSSTMVEIYK